MEARSLSTVFILLLAIPNFEIVLIFKSAQAGSTTIVVPVEFSTIQEAIDNAASMDTIIVNEGVYNETVSIGKTISLIAEGGRDTIIDAGRNGYTIDVHANNVTIRGFTIQNGVIGIYMENSDGNTISRNNITANDRGVVLSESHRNRITTNALHDNYGNGIELQRSNHNYISGNFVTKNPAFGIYVALSENNTIVENVVTEICDGISLENATNNRVSRNTVADTSPYGIYLNHADSNTLNENVVTRNNLGIQLLGSRNNAISGNQITKNSYGVIATTSEGNILRENTMTSNFYNFGVFGTNLSHYVNDVDDSNSVDGKPIFYMLNQHNKTVPANAGYVAVLNSTNITLKDLNLNRNMHGILLAYSQNVTIQNVTATGNFAGGLFFWNSNNSTIKNTQITRNIFGISLYNSSGNRFYHNNIVNNVQQVETNQSTNYWDDGYPAGGNYWGESIGVDEKSGPTQTQIGADGTLDQAYTVDSNNRDRYPLSGQILQLPATTWNNIAYFIEVESNSDIFNFRFDPTEGPLMTFSVASPNGSTGFAKAIIPKQLLYVDEQDEWKVFIEDKQEFARITEDENHTYLYFKYEQSAKNIRIEGTRVIGQEDAGPFGINADMILFAVALSIIGCLTLGLLTFLRSRKHRS